MSIDNKKNIYVHGDHSVTHTIFTCDKFYTCKVARQYGLFHGLSSSTTIGTIFHMCCRCTVGLHDEVAHVYAVLQLLERIAGRPHICMGEDRLSPVTGYSSCPSPHCPSSTMKKI